MLIEGPSSFSKLCVIHWPRNHGPKIWREHNYKRASKNNKGERVGHADNTNIPLIECISTTHTQYYVNKITRKETNCDNGEKSGLKN
jgi:hypothetical protein